MGVDVAALKTMFAEDFEIFSEIFGDFKDTHQNLIDDIQGAIEAGDASKLEISAHTLKGVLATFNALEAKEMAFALEKKGHDGETSETQEILDKMKEEIKSVIEELGEVSF